VQETSMLGFVGLMQARKKICRIFADNFFARGGIIPI
jgi:hypothetical protein